MRSGYVKIDRWALWKAVKELGPNRARIIDLERKVNPKQGVQLTLVLKDGDFYSYRNENGVTVIEVQIVE